MKNFLKGVASMAIVMVITILIHMCFNLKGIELDNYLGYSEILLITSFTILIYNFLTKNDKKDNQK